MKTCNNGHDYDNTLRKRQACPICDRATRVAWDTKNAEIKSKYNKQYNKKYRENNPEYAKNWRKNNSGKVTAATVRYIASKLQRTPKWLTKEQLKEIEEFYVLAKELRWLSEEPLEVDHIIPLRGKHVSGLHVPWNLQILPKSLNRSKNNKFIAKIA